MDPLQNQNPPIIQNPPINQPPSTQQQTPPPFSYVANPKPPSKKPFIKIIFMVFLALTVLVFSSTVMFAYGLIPVGSEEFRDKIAGIIMKIPFMPKTPRYVLITSAQVHEKITRMSIDASLATSSTSLGGMFGMSNLDIQAKGSFDYTNIDNLKADFNVKITKDFDLDVKVLDQKAYLKVNSYPSIVGVMLTSMGIPEDTLKGISNKWLYYDLSTLDTEARRNLLEQKDNFDLNDSNKKMLEVLSDKDIAKSVSMMSDKLDGISAYHILFKPTDEVFEKLLKIYLSSTPNSNDISKSNISKSIKNFKLDVWIDATDYFVRKMTVGLVIKSPGASYSMPSIDSMGLPLSQQEEVPISFVVKYSDFGKEVTVTAPPNPIKFEDFLKTLMESASTATKSATVVPSKKLPVGV